MSRVRGLPAAAEAPLALAELSSFLGASPRDIRTTATATRVPLAAGVLGTSVDGHLAHALYAAAAGGVEDALVVVCDSAARAGFEAFLHRGGPGGGLTRVQAEVGSFRIAELYSIMTEALGFSRGQDEHVVEAMARTAQPVNERLASRLQIGGDGLAAPPDFAAYLLTAITASPRDDVKAQARIAASVQQRLRDALTELLTRLAAATGARRLVVAGGLFYNTSFTTTAAGHPAFDSVFVPAHPGNGGCAIGAALAMGDARLRATIIGSPFLGPSYTREQVKQTLDNCKLSYDVLPEGRVQATVIDALSRGQLAGWFSGRMEWGPRALGHRSVLASPFSPYVLENLNGFLKRRAWYRTYGVSVPLKDLDRYFIGPPASPYMQFEYTPRDPELLRHILPEGATRIRVHTVTDDEPRFLSLLDQWGQQAPAPILVNTSFNGFHEPLVCTPRDAVRVFYGTGLDVLAAEDFVIRK
ncbi:MAG: carbamoyltransferase C-terminal domain-containing protein [Acidobacteriota bacterium]